MLLVMLLEDRGMAAKNGERRITTREAYVKNQSNYE